MMIFHCKRCGACCKPGWTVPKKLDPARTWSSSWTVWMDTDVERAAAFLGISFDQFVSKYDIVDDVAIAAKAKNLTRKEYLKSEAKKYKFWFVKRMLKKRPMYRQYRLMVNDNNCPFVNENNECSIYKARPNMCRDFPSPAQLTQVDEQGESFFQPHCPGFEEGDN